MGSLMSSAQRSGSAPGWGLGEQRGGPISAGGGVEAPGRGSTGRESHPLLPRKRSRRRVVPGWARLGRGATCTCRPLGPQTVGPGASAGSGQPAGRASAPRPTAFTPRRFGARCRHACAAARGRLGGGRRRCARPQQHDVGCRVPRWLACVQPMLHKLRCGPHGNCRWQLTPAARERIATVHPAQRTVPTAVGAGPLATERILVQLPTVLTGMNATRFGDSWDVRK